MHKIILKDISENHTAYKITYHGKAQLWEVLEITKYTGLESFLATGSFIQKSHQKVSYRTAEQPWFRVVLTPKPTPHLHQDLSVLKDIKEHHLEPVAQANLYLRWGNRDQITLP